MNSDYIILAIVAVVGIGGSLFVYYQAKQLKMNERRAAKNSYEEVQQMVNKRVLCATVAAVLTCVLGLVAIYLLR